MYMGLLMGLSRSSIGFQKSTNALNEYGSNLTYFRHVKLSCDIHISLHTQQIEGWFMALGGLSNLL